MRVKEDRNFVTMLLLTIVTCGIYGIYFWYKYSEDMNIVCQGDGENTTNYILIWLLSMVTCGIFLFVWVYKVGDRLQKTGQRYGVDISESGTTLLLWYLVGAFLFGIGPLVANYFMINNMNKISAAYNRQVPVQM